MKIKHLFGACLLLSSLAACTNQEDLPTTGGTDITTPEGAVVFSLEGLGSGSVDTRATILATTEENRIDALDIYVFAYDGDGTFDEDVTDAGALAGLTPDDAAAANNALWYLQEKWSYVKNDGKFAGVNKPDLSRPDLHEIVNLGGSGVARTAVIYPKKGRFLKFFIVANSPELVATEVGTGNDIAYEPKFNNEGSTAQTPVNTAGTTAADFLALRLELSKLNATGDINAAPIACPLPMTAQMATTKATTVDMTANAAPEQVTRGATLTRAVTRFDVANYAAFQAKGDFRLNEVFVYNTYQHVALNNEVAAGAAVFAPTRVNLKGRTWTTQNNNSTDPTFGGLDYKVLPSAFYTSPSLGGTTVKLGLRGDLGSSTAAPGEALTGLNKEVEILDPNSANTPKDALVLKANYRYLLNIKQLGSDINVIFSILDWDSEILDADFSNAPMPALIVEDDPRIGLNWEVAADNMDNHFVEMTNPRLGDANSRLAFGLGLYNEDELADILALIQQDGSYDAGKMAKLIPFEAQVQSLSQDESHPTDNIWLTQPVITFDMTARDRFQVVMDVRPETEVPLSVRPDLLVSIWNKEKKQKRIYFRVTSKWDTAVGPQP